MCKFAGIRWAKNAFLWSQWGLNPRSSAYEAAALTAKLQDQNITPHPCVVMEQTSLKMKTKIPRKTRKPFLCLVM